MMKMKRNLSLALGGAVFLIPALAWAGVKGAELLSWCGCPCCGG